MTTLKVQKRDLGSNVKALRRTGLVTGNLFGKDIKGSIPLQMDVRDAEKLWKECPKGSKLKVQLGTKKYDVLLKEVDLDTIKGSILEIDFQTLVKGEKVHSVAEIVLRHKDMLKEGLADLRLNEIAYKATPDNIVEKVEIDCSKLKIGDCVLVKDLDIAKNENIEITTHMDATVLNVILPHVAHEAAPAAEEETAPAPAPAPAAE